MWLGQDSEFRIAVPDASYKIVIRETVGGDVIPAAFIFPNIVPRSLGDMWHFSTTISRIEKLTGLKFLTNLTEADKAVVAEIKSGAADW